MKKIVIASGLVVSIAVSGVASAQDLPPVINADGDSAASEAGLNPAVDATGPTIVYGDVNTGPGTNVIGIPPEAAPVAPTTTLEPLPGENLTATSGEASALGAGNASAAPGTVTRDGVSGTSLLGPDGTYSVTDTPASTVSVGEAAPAPVEPVYEEPIYEEPVYDETVAVEPVAADTAAVVDGDADADNLADSLEYELGLDPYNIDGDGDGIADGDEINIYGTDAFAFDTDGDALSDGDELFALGTDPLFWDSDNDSIGDGVEVLTDGTDPLSAPTVV